MILLAFLTGPAVAGELQGVWRGTGLDERYTLIFSGDVLIATIGNHPLNGTKESGFTAADGQIDIQRSEGLQLGVYAVEGDTLTLTLANTGQERPTKINQKPRYAFRTFVFQRGP